MTGQGKNGIDFELAKSLKILAEKYPIEKITIKQITDQAGVIRPTFYNHFQDKYELLEWIIRTEILEPLHPLISNGMIEPAMVLLFTNLEKDKKFYTKLVKMEGPVLFSDIATKCVKETLLEAILTLAEGKTPKYEWLTPNIIAGYYAQSMCFACINWIEHDMAIPPEQMAEAYQYIITRSMDDVIREM